MWDITVPGDNDHDFYVQTANAGVLVHNCGSLLVLQQRLVISDSAGVMRFAGGGLAAASPV
jgi:hypothetical protein